MCSHSFLNIFEKRFVGFVDFGLKWPKKWFLVSGCGEKFNLFGQKDGGKAKNCINDKNCLVGVKNSWGFNELVKC